MECPNADDQTDKLEHKRVSFQLIEQGRGEHKNLFQISEQKA